MQRPLRRHAIVTFVTTALLTAGSFGAQAQQVPELRPTASVSAGAFFFDLSGTGTAPMLSLRGDYPLSRYVAIDGGLGIARPAQQFGATTTFLAPELGVQLQIPTRFSPYLSADIGESYDVRASEFGGTVHGNTFSGGVGGRFWLDARTALRGELRVRAIGWGGASASSELTFGVARRF